MITSILSFYPCTHLQETQLFYTQVIGLQQVFSSDTVRIFASPKGYIGFVDYKDGQIAKPHLCISFNCPTREAVDQEYQRLCAMGHTPKNPPSLHPSQPVYSFFLQDPNGYLVEYEKIEGITL